ncbi:MAG: potassium/proton antiporter [Candidatus Competibacteraceae bacterium]|nr:potassium/proton antiporter [Candidatus Competibacteraceae bacterium]MBK7983514.1 potassium/proton antiporter [Candidatus Competibacteraceae bacterium]MBK8897946.1 potassium/proton antiporter [Candidatus Competibacteraceae bacterium]MBK8961749.1 potassium/proton antiporter [Candidatus Competibacteraceae bacterium]MBK9950965.1 potassium/proton antiporter [Candidatus Competibacteraceae bacterium]
MDFTNQLILLIGVLFLLCVLASTISARLGLPLLLVFLALGMLAGEDGPGGIRFDDVQTTYMIGTVALVVILFNGGLCTDIGSFRVGLGPALWLATVGVVVTAGLTGLAAMWFLELPWLEGLLVGAIVGSTDAAAVFSILHSHGLRLKQRVDATLQIESGANDPMAIFLTVTLVNLLAAGGTALDWKVGIQFFQQMGIGAAVGLGGGWALVWLINRITLNVSLYPLLAFSGGMLIFGTTAVAGGSGYLAVYFAGIVLGNRPLQNIDDIRRFHDGLAWLSQMSMFLILGLLITPHELSPSLAMLGLLIALTLILIARPVAVAVCLLPFRFNWRERVFIGWIGLRGAVPIILALFPWLAGLEYYRLYFNVAFFIVLLSLVIQGWTVAPMARWLKLQVPPSASALARRLRLDVPAGLDYELLSYWVTGDSPAIGRAWAELILPEGVRLVGLIRNGRMIDSDAELRLQDDDHVFLLGRAADLALLDPWFAASERLPEYLEPSRFFGEMALDAEASMADIALLYGLKPDPEAAVGTLEGYLNRQFDNPVVGDRARVGRVEFVVREMRGKRITKVGMRLNVTERPKSKNQQPPRA